jgi:hypothetical protein
MQPEQTLLTYPTWKKYIVLSSTVASLRMRDKRIIFDVMRNTPDLTHDTFFPYYGFTAGHFCMWQILSEKQGGAPCRV